jgi:hypothetical protein
MCRRRSFVHRYARVCHVLLERADQNFTVDQTEREQLCEPKKWRGAAEYCGATSPIAPRQTAASRRKIADFFQRWNQSRTCITIAFTG